VGNPSGIGNRKRFPPWPNGTPALGGGYRSDTRNGWTTSREHLPWDPPSWGKAPEPPGRIALGWSLVLTALRLIRETPSLLLIPVITFVTTTAAAFFGAVLTIKLLRVALLHGNHVVEALEATGGLLCLMAAVAVFSTGRAAIIWRASAHLNGNTCLNRGAYAKALARTPALLGWVLLSITAGWIFQVTSAQHNIGKPFGHFNRFVDATGLMAWWSVTYLVVPIILFEDRGPLQAISRARSLARHQWREQLVGRGGLMLLTLGCLILAGVAGFLLGELSTSVGFATGTALAVGVIVLSFVASCALEAVFYHLAMTSPPSVPVSLLPGMSWRLWP
jgi:hypothetical protein